jgi:hypothetical protein
VDAPHTSHEGGYYGYPYDYHTAPNFGVTLPSAQTLETFRLHGIVASVCDHRTPSTKAVFRGKFTDGHDRRHNDERFLPAMTAAAARPPAALLPERRFARVVSRQAFLYRMG